MKKKEYDNLVELSYTGGYMFRPSNQNSYDLCDSLGIGEIVTFETKSNRDLSLHRCYFLMINFIYDYLPDNFKHKVPRDHFYKWLQTLKGEYEVIFEFKDGSKLVDYESISFGKMSNERFKAYIKEQMPWVYENVIGIFYKDEQYDAIIETIEKEFEKFFAKLD